MADTTQPRAVVAISEDRQWLVTHEPPNTLRYKFPDESCFYVWQRNGAMGAGIEMRPVDAIADTGQDAHEVLREWMEGREAPLPKPIGCLSESECDGSCQHCEDVMFDRMGL